MVGVIRTPSDTSSRHAEYSIKPPRPQNSWILYRQEHCKRFTQTNPGVPQSEVSRLIAHQWKNETPEIKRHWEQKAEEEKAKHALKYPGYRYSPATKASKTKQKEAAKQEKKVLRAQKSTLVDVNADASAAVTPALPSPSSSSVPSPHSLPGSIAIASSPYSHVNVGAAVNPAVPFPPPSVPAHSRPAPIVIPPNPYLIPYAPNAGYMLSRTGSLMHQGPIDANANAPTGAAVNPALPTPSPSTVASPHPLSGSAMITPNPYFMPYAPNAGYTPSCTAPLAHQGLADTNLGVTMAPAFPSPSTMPSAYPLPEPTVNPYFTPYANTNVGAAATPALPFPSLSTVPSAYPPGPTVNSHFIPQTDTNASVAVAPALPTPLPSTVPSPCPPPGPTVIPPNPYFDHYTNINASVNASATVTPTSPSPSSSIVPSSHPPPGPTSIPQNPYFTHNAGCTLPLTAPLTRESSTLPESCPQNTQGMDNVNTPFDAELQELLSSNLDEFFDSLREQYSELLTLPSGDLEVLMGSQALEGSNLSGQTAQDAFSGMPFAPLSTTSQSSYVPRSDTQ